MSHPRAEYLTRQTRDDRATLEKYGTLQGCPFDEPLDPHTPMAFAKRIDENQPRIVANLRRIGATVQVLSMVGKGCPDILDH